MKSSGKQTNHKHNRQKTTKSIEHIQNTYNK